MHRSRYPSAAPQNRTPRQAPSPVLRGMIGNALEHHRHGRLADAERIYRQILAIDPRHADSLHLLGTLAHQIGRDEIAVALIRKAIAINGMTASYHSNLGTVLQAEGKLDEAAACYRSALALKPDLAEAQMNLGAVLQAQGRLNDAEVRFRRALALKPDLAEVHVNLGNILQVQGKLDEAVASHERALAFKPQLSEAHYNLGNTRQAQGDLEAAVACYERALALRPDYAEAHHNMGCVLRALGRLDEALARFGRAVELQPDYAQARFSQALAQLLNGDFTTGWRNFEGRWQSPDHDTPMRAYPQPLWAGEQVTSGPLLLWGEQGIGDEIMFAGLVPDAIRTGNRIVLDCDARLQPLFARSFPGVEVVSGCGPVESQKLRAPSFPVLSAERVGTPPASPPQPASAHRDEQEIAAHLPTGSLPGLFRATEPAFAVTTSPYLQADPVERERFRARYGDGRRLVGLAWRTKNQETGRKRSIDLELLAPLFALPGIRWISLQYGDFDDLEHQAAAANAPILEAPILIDRTVDQFANIDLFAAQVAAMDQVISIDNSTAHLAGSLGVPVWLLLPFAPDWRWLQAREHSPWYPTMHLFRQPKLGDWQSVIESVRSGLGDTLNCP